MRWIHAAAMGAAFSLVFAGMLFPRCLKRRRWWLQVHRLLAACGAALGAAGVGIAAYLVAVSGRTHLPVLHFGFGAGTLALLVGTPLLGSVMLRLRRNPKLLRAIHRWCGRAAILAMMLNGVLGLLQAGMMRR